MISENDLQSKMGVTHNGQSVNKGYPPHDLVRGMEVVQLKENHRDSIAMRTGGVGAREDRGDKVSKVNRKSVVG